MRCWSLLIGARTLGAKSPRFRPADDRLIREITTRHFPEGFTILEARGGWFDPERRRFIDEESRQVLICGANAKAVRRWGRELGRALRQKELIVIRSGSALRLKMSGKS